MAYLDIESLITVARDLARGGRWAPAQALLAAAEAADAHEAGAIAVAAADAEADRAFWMRHVADPDVLATARELATGAVQVWTAGFAQLRADYAPQLWTRIAGEPPDDEAVARLAAAAERLAETAPDPASRAYATFYRGLIAGVLQDDSVAGEKYYRAAAETDDEYVRSYALRHLGWVADEAGRPDEAIKLWRESTRLRQRVGFVPGTLAQLQLIVAHTSVQRVVEDWATELDIGDWIMQAAGVDPEDA
jgi:tetratricopeptide (TPR) repeat protein